MHSSKSSNCRLLTPLTWVCCNHKHVFVKSTLLMHVYICILPCGQPLCWKAPAVSLVDPASVLDFHWPVLLAVAVASTSLQQVFTSCFSCFLFKLIELYWLQYCPVGAAETHKFFIIVWHRMEEKKCVFFFVFHGLNIKHAAVFEPFLILRTYTKGPVL